MLTRREYLIRPQIAPLVGIFAISAALTLAAVAVLLAPVTPTLHGVFVVAGSFGICLFGTMALFFAALLPKARKRKGALLLLDEHALHYGGLTIQWPLLREAVLCKYIRRRFVGLRTIDDRAMANAMSKRVPAVLGLSLQFLRWRTKCALVIPAVEGATLEELQQTIEEYRIAFGSAADAPAS